MPIITTQEINKLVNVSARHHENITQRLSYEKVKIICAGNAILNGGHRESDVWAEKEQVSSKRKEKTKLTFMEHCMPWPPSPWPPWPPWSPWSPWSPWPPLSWPKWYIALICLYKQARKILPVYITSTRRRRCGTINSKSGTHNVNVQQHTNKLFVVEDTMIVLLIS